MLQSEITLLFHKKSNNMIFKRHTALTLTKSQALYNIISLFFMLVTPHDLWQTEVVLMNCEEIMIMTNCLRFSLIMIYFYSL